MTRLGLLGLQLLLILVVVSFNPHLFAWDLPGDFFPDGTFDSFEGEQWFGKYLSSMHEPSLDKLARRDASAEVYRVTYLPCYSPYLALKLEVHPDGSGLLELKKMEQIEEKIDDVPSYGPGRMVRNATFIISKKEVAQFKALLKATGFWHLTARRDSNSLGGDMFIYECARLGSYHVVEIPVPPDDALISPGLYLIKLAGEQV
jgi:hypothetical protein